MKSNFFTDCKTIEDLKQEYRRLVKIYHPDNGGIDSETIKIINMEYDSLFNVLKDIHNAKSENATNQNTEEPEDFRNIINELMKIPGLEIELCGNWLWIGGNSYPYREILKSLGCKYASKKKLWYLGELQSKRKKSMSMEHIRNKYGSEVYASERVLCLV